MPINMPESYWPKYAQSQYESAIEGYNSGRMPVRQVIELLLLAGHDLDIDGWKKDDMRLNALIKAAEIASSEKRPIEFIDKDSVSNALLRKPELRELGSTNKKLAIGIFNLADNFIKRADLNDAQKKKLDSQLKLTQAHLYERGLLDDYDPRLKELKSKPSEFQKYKDAQIDKFLKGAADGGSPEGAIEYGQLLMEKGKASEAIPQFEKVLTYTEDPKLMAKANSSLGRAFEESDNPRVAGRYYARALNLDPTLNPAGKEELIKEAIKDRTFNPGSIYMHSPEDLRPSAPAAAVAATGGAGTGPIIPATGGAGTTPPVSTAAAAPAAPATDQWRTALRSSSPEPRRAAAPVAPAVSAAVPTAATAAAAPAPSRVAQLAYQDVARDLGTLPAAGAATPSTAPVTAPPSGDLYNSWRTINDKLDIMSRYHDFYKALRLMEKDRSVSPSDINNPQKILAWVHTNLPDQSDYFDKIILTDEALARRQQERQAAGAASAVPERVPLRSTPYDSDSKEDEFFHGTSPAAGAASEPVRGRATMVAAGGGYGGGGGDDDPDRRRDLGGAGGDGFGLPRFEPLPMGDLRRPSFDRGWVDAGGGEEPPAAEPSAGAAGAASARPVGNPDIKYEQNPGDDFRIAFQRFIADQGLDYFNKPYEPYEGERVANLDPFEVQSIKQLLRHYETRPETRIEDYAREGLMREMAHTPSLDASKRFLSNVQDIRPEEINRYYREFQQDVLDPIRRDAMANFDEETVPGIYSNFIGHGAFGGGRMAKMREQAREKLLRGLHAQEAALKSNFYQTAAGLAKANKEHALAGGRYAGTFAAEDAARRERALGALHSMAGIEEQRRLQNIALAQQAGKLQREARQAKLAADYERHQEARAEPLKRLSALHGLSGGFPIDAAKPPMSPESLTSAAAPPSRSVYTQLGGLGMGLGGMMGSAEEQRRNLSQILSGNQTASMAGLTGARGTYMDGGRVHRAAGGSITDQVMQRLKMQATDPAVDTITGMKNMSKGYESMAQSNAPMNNFMSQFGFGVMGAPREMNTMEAVGRSASAALPAFHEGLEKQVGYANKSVAMKEAIQNTLQTMRKEEEDRAFKREKLNLEREELEMNRDFKNQSLRLQAAGIGQKTNKMQQAIDKEVILKANNYLANANQIGTLLNDLKKKIEKTPTGGFNSLINKVNPLATDYKSDIQQIDAKASDLVNKYKDVYGVRNETEFKALEKAKVNSGYTQEANLNIVEKQLAAHHEEIQKANFILDAYKKGIPTTEATKAFADYMNYKYAHPNERVTPSMFLDIGEETPSDRGKGSDLNVEELSKDEMLKLYNGGH